MTAKRRIQNVAKHFVVVASGLIVGSLLLAGCGAILHPASANAPRSTATSSPSNPPVTTAPAAWHVTTHRFPVGTVASKPQVGLTRKVGSCVKIGPVETLAASDVLRLVSPVDRRDWVALGRAQPVLHLGTVTVPLPAGRYVWGGMSLYQLGFQTKGPRPQVVPSVGGHLKRVYTPIVFQGPATTSLHGALLFNMSGRLWFYHPDTGGHYLPMHVPKNAQAYLSPCGRHLLLIKAGGANGIWSLNVTRHGDTLTRDVSLPVGSYTNAVWSGRAVAIEGTVSLAVADLPTHRVINYRRASVNAIGPLTGGAFWLGGSLTPSRQALWMMGPEGSVTGPILAGSALVLAGRTADSGRAVIMQWIVHYPNPGTGYLPPSPPTYDIPLIANGCAEKG